MIRVAVLTDAARLSAIYAHYVEHTAITFEYVAPTEAEFHGRMAQTLKRYPYLVAEVDGAVMGYAYAGPLKERAAYDWACELSIYLDPAAKGHGLGRALYQAMEAALRGMGILNMYACIAWPVVEDEYLDRSSAAFHAHMGFHEVGRFAQSGYKFGRWYDTIWMEKLIGEHGAVPSPITPFRELSTEACAESGLV